MGKPARAGGKTLHPECLERLGGGGGRGDAAASRAAGGRRQTAPFDLFWKQPV